jgi:hypothetical protein
VARHDLYLPEGPPVHEHVAPAAFLVEIPLYLEFDVVADLAVQPAAPGPEIVGDLVDVRVEPPEVKLQFEAQVQPRSLSSSLCGAWGV